MITKKFVLGFALAGLTMFQAFARCPADAVNSGHYVTLVAITTNGAPIGSRQLIAGEEIIITVAAAYISMYPTDDAPLAAFGDGRLLVVIGGEQVDVTPPGGVPLIGPPECGANPFFFSQPLSYTISLQDARVGSLVVRAIYTNGLAEFDTWAPIWAANSQLIGAGLPAVQGPSAPSSAVRAAHSPLKSAPLKKLAPPKRKAVKSQRRPQSRRIVPLASQRIAVRRVN